MPPRRVVKTEEPKRFKPVTPKMREGGFTRLRHGIFDHTKTGELTIYDFAVLATLWRWVNYHTGVTTTSAASIAANWGEWDSIAEQETDTEATKAKRKRRTVQSCLLRLRKKGYINYRQGDGKRGCYAILLNKFEPTEGALLGWSLDVTGTGDDLEDPMYKYVSPTPFVEAYGEKYEAQHMTPCAEDVRSTVQSVCAATYGQCAVNCTPHCTVRVRLKEVLKMHEDVYEERQEGKSRKSLTRSVAPPVPSSASASATTSYFSLEDDDDEPETTGFSFEEDDDDDELVTADD